VVPDISGRKLTENVGEIDATWSPDGTQLAFGRLSTGADTGTNDIHVVDMKDPPVLHVTWL
jgi:tricorn protease-like protein